MKLNKSQRKLFNGYLTLMLFVGLLLGLILGGMLVIYDPAYQTQNVEVVGIVFVNEIVGMCTEQGTQLTAGIAYFEVVQ